MIVGRQHSERFGCLVGTDPGGPFLNAGRAPCILAFHGFTGTTSEIRPMLDRLVDRGYAVHAPLLPGHGSNPTRLQDATFDVWVAAMRRELIAAQQRHRHVILCGFSLGSLIAMELAATNEQERALSHLRARGSLPLPPRATTTAASAATPPNEKEPPPGLLGLVLLGNAITLTAPVRAALGFVDRQRWTLPDWYLLKLWSSDIRDPEQKKRIAAYDRDPLRAALEVYRGGRRALPRLPSITCPTLILHGGKDRVCPPSNMHLVAKHLGTPANKVETHLYPKSGHLVAADLEREEVAERVASFVDAQAATCTSFANDPVVAKEAG